MKEYKVKVFDDRTEWYKSCTDILHRENGPAIELADGDKYWYKGGKKHRLDGPAIEYANGEKLWYIEGKKYTEAEFLRTNKQIDPCDGKLIIIEGKEYKLTLVDN